MYILEGNIGAGKTTLLQFIRDQIPDIEAVFEPVDSWHKQTAGQSLLANFYQDIPRWAFTLETYAMACRVREHVIEQKKTNCRRLMERSIFSGHYCFARNDFLNGYLDQIEWDTYNRWFNMLTLNKCHVPIGFIYLRSQPDVCLNRVKARARAGECSITVEYLEQVHRVHEDFLLNRTESTEELRAVPVLVLDGNQDISKNPSLLHDYTGKISQFIDQTMVGLRTDTCAHRPQCT